jgi:hypothetical protein
MTTIIQVKDFLSGLHVLEINLGSFFSLKSAEDHLGWYFIHTACLIERF